MSVNEGAEAEYERRHRPIWRELEETLLAHGVRTYSIYLDPETGDCSATRSTNRTSSGTIVDGRVPALWRHHAGPHASHHDDSLVSTTPRGVHIER